MIGKIDEEFVDQLSSMNFCDWKRPAKISNPINIGHHTVSGHEALNLAKRLSEELATHNQTQSGNLTRAISPEVEPISRSYDKKGKLFVLCTQLILRECLSRMFLKRLNYLSFFRKFFRSWSF